MTKRDDGLSLIELMVVIMIVSVLVAVAIPSLLGFRARASDGRIMADLTSTSKAEAGYNTVNGAYTDDGGELSALIPEIELGSGSDKAVRIVVGDVDPGDSNRVLLYARSATGNWIGIRLVAVGPDSGRYTCIGNDESDMTLANCSGTQW